MKFKLIIFVTIMLSLTAYNIYGGIVNREEININDAIEETFDTIKNSLGHRDIDIIIRDNLKYTVENIEINNNYANANIELTGVDLAQSFYEMDMFHAFYRDFSINSPRLFTEPIMDTYNVYVYILTKNIGNTQNTNLTLQLTKSNGIWKVANISEIYRALENSSISLTTLTNMAYENLEKARVLARERYEQEKPASKTFEDYWIDYLYDFITNGGYVTQFPFEEQPF